MMKIIYIYIYISTYIFHINTFQPHLNCFINNPIENQKWVDHSDIHFNVIPYLDPYNRNTSSFNPFFSLLYSKFTNISQIIFSLVYWFTSGVCVRGKASSSQSSSHPHTQHRRHLIGHRCSRGLLRNTVATRISSLCISLHANSSSDGRYNYRSTVFCGF